MAAADTITPGWFSIEGAAIYTGFSSRALRTAIRLQRFPVRRVDISGSANGSVRIKRAHLDAWIEGREIPADPP